MSTRKSFDNETAQSIGRRIKEVRGARTQQEFGESLGVDRATLANYESGRRLPNDSVLKKLAEMSGRSVPEFLFGAPVFDYKAVNAKITADIAALAAKHPGVIPRWALSDDEMALVAAFRISESPIAFARRLVTEVEKIQAAEREATGLPAFGEAHVKRLREAVERGHFEEGYDPDAALWATLIEERLKREDEGPQ